jgi:hypothetical protein
MFRLLSVFLRLAGPCLAQTAAWTVSGTGDQVALQACAPDGQCVGLKCFAQNQGNPQLSFDLRVTSALPPASGTLRIEVDGQAFEANFFNEMFEEVAPIHPYVGDLMPLSPNPFLDLLANSAALKIPQTGGFSGVTLRIDGFKHGLAAFRSACGAFAAAPLPVAPTPAAPAVDEVDLVAYRVLFDEVTVRGQAVCEGGKAVVSDEAFIPQPDGTIEVNTGFLECSLPGLTFPFCGATGFCAIWTYALQSGRYVLVRDELRRG